LSYKIRFFYFFLKVGGFGHFLGGPGGWGGGGGRRV